MSVEHLSDMWGKLLYLWPLLLGLSFWAFLSYIKPYIKGYIGEKAISFILYFLNKKRYKVLNDVKIPHKSGFAQIDHLVISAYGIFVIETKHYKGIIYGSEASYHWTQVLGRKQYKFYNPILQNKGHIIALRQALRAYPQLRYISLIVFTWRSTLKIEVSTPVIKYYWLYVKILFYRKKCLTTMEVAAITAYLERINGKSYRLVDQFMENGSAARCPQCAGILVVRSGKYGFFKGCQNYPSCDYTTKIDRESAIRERAIS